jgi:preprotein translocase subunit SecG
MKKVAAILAFSFFALSIQAQEAPAKEKTKKEATKKEATKTKTECKAEGKKCCSSKKSK